MLDAQMIKGPANLRQTQPVDLATSFGRVKIMAAAIGVKAHRQAMGAEHLGQPLEA